MSTGHHHGADHCPDCRRVWNAAVDEILTTLRDSTNSTFDADFRKGVKFAIRLAGISRR